MPISFSFNEVMGTRSRTDEVQPFSCTVSPPKSHSFSRFHSSALLKLDRTSPTVSNIASSHPSFVSQLISHLDPYKHFSMTLQNSIDSPSHYSISSVTVPAVPISSYDSCFNTTLRRSISPLTFAPSSCTSRLIASSPYRPPGHHPLLSSTADFLNPLFHLLWLMLHIGLFTTRWHPAVGQLMLQVFHILLNICDPSSHAAGILRFTQFCDSWRISEDARMPTSATLIAAFVSQCRGLYAGNTVRSLLSGICSWHIYHQADWHGDHEWVQQARTTASKEGTAFQ